MATKTKRKRKTLAHVKKLSTLLEIGLRDLRKQEMAENSEVDMQTCLKRNGKCVACLGGSVMRFSLGNRAKEAWFNAYDSETCLRLSALDSLRKGFVDSAAYSLGVPTSIQLRYVQAYDGPNGEWWKAMRQLLKELKDAGE